MPVIIIATWMFTGLIFFISLTRGRLIYQTNHTVKKSYYPHPFLMHL